MADLWTIQSNLTRGQLDPLLMGRVDLQAYYNGVQEATNVKSIPQGGMRKRGGLEYIAESLGDGRMESFSFNVEQTYLLVFTAAKMEIYKDDVLQTNIAGSGNDYLTVPWTYAQTMKFDYIQSADTIIITHPDVATQVITRTSDTAWAIAAVTFTNIPQYDFNDASSPTPTSEVQSLNFAAQTEGDTYRISLEGLLTDEIAWANEDATNQENIRIALQALASTGNSGISVAVTGALDTYAVTFANEAAKPWDLMAVTAVDIVGAPITCAVTRTTTGVARKEDVWSAGRGYPRTCTFHEGRLWLGGSSSLPASVWGSRINDFYNFDQGRGLDDESVFATLDTDQVNAVEGIFSNRSLQVFTSGGEFYVPTSPITPSNIAVTPQSNLGAKRVRPVTVDGVTLFVQRTGKAIIQFVFVDAFKANQSRSVSILSPSIISDPVQMAVSRGTSDTDANYVYIVNDDGTLAVFNTLVAEDVAGFTVSYTGNYSLANTVDLIKSCAVVDNELYVLVKRIINTVTKYYIEKENPDLHSDSSETRAAFSASTITGLGRLEAQWVWVVADSNDFIGIFLVTSGVVTLTETLTADLVEIGIPYGATIETMPLNVSLENGPNAAAKKKIARVSLQVYDANAVLVNGVKIIYPTVLGPATGTTGLVRRFLLGWSLEATVTIAQVLPYNFTLLNVGVEMKT